jgi:hypothetical protein
MNIMQLKQAVLTGSADAALSAIYAKDQLKEARERVLSLIDTFTALHGEDARELLLLSVPGRSELSGNHTDHNHGRVIAASIDLDVLVLAAARADGNITVHSEGFAPEMLTVSPIPTPAEVKVGTSGALIAGMVDGFASMGFAYGGFDAVMMTTGMDNVKQNIDAIDGNENATDKDLDLLTTLEVVYEFYLRGLEFLPIDIYKSHATKFLIEDGKLRPPFVAISGLGENAAISLMEGREGKDFLSIEEVAAACPKVSKTHIQMLKQAGAFEDLPDTSQVSLFW